MGNGRQKAMEYFSSDEGKQALQSMRESLAATTNEIKNLSMPAFHFDASAFQPHLPQNNFGEKFNDLIRLNEEQNKTNKKISDLLLSAQEEICSLRTELEQIKKSHMHDFRNNAVIALISSLLGAAAGIAFTIWATKNGLLK